MSTVIIFFAFFSPFVIFFVRLFANAVRRDRTYAAKKLLKVENPSLYFRIHKFILKNESVESLLFCSTLTLHIFRLFLLLSLFFLYFENTEVQPAILYDYNFLAFIALLFVLFVVILDLIPRIVAATYCEKSLTFSKGLASFFLLLTVPFTFSLHALLAYFFPTSFLSPFTDPTVSSKERLVEMIQEIDERTLLTEHDKKLLQSVLSFRDRIVREVMVPRVDLFCLAHDTSIRNASFELQQEGYSRVPVFKGTQDHILGILMYKDVLLQYMEADAMPTGSATSSAAGSPSILDAPIESIVKNALFVPETKKISQLLQEFRKKQTHIAVVVDEYGGTAGIVTIEDILEEIVGEIADEYDEEEKQYWALSRGGWIVDGRMNLNDLEEELEIKLPQEGDYDTLAGYVYYRLGTIPKKGTVLDQDDFHLEILSSGESFVEKVKIIPLKKSREK